MARIGLVLGAGGVTGAAYEIGALMALRLATGWDPNQSDVVVGTSGGAFVGSLVRHGALALDSLVQPDDDRAAVAERIRSHVYVRDPGVSVVRWLRHGLIPGALRPGLTLFLGSPAPFTARGLADWVVSQIGDEAAGRWPGRPTVVVAYDMITHRRVAFGTRGAPETGIGEAVAASSSIPVLFRPYPIGDRLYVDGGVGSGTNADLVLGATRPLDLVLVLAPFAAEHPRKRAWVHERMFDRVGSRSLAEESAMIRAAWPDCEVITLSPAPSVQNVMRPNPLDASRAVATFTRTLVSMKRRLSDPEVWERLDHHLSRSSLGVAG